MRSVEALDTPDSRRDRALESTSWPARLSLLLVLAIALPAAAQLTQRTVSQPESADQLKTKRQLDQVDELARRHLGRRVRGRSTDELDVLQRLLDERFIRADDTFAQQSLGVALGNILATQLPLSWVVVDDDHGHSRALRYRESDDRGRRTDRIRGHHARVLSAEDLHRLHPAASGRLISLQGVKSRDDLSLRRTAASCSPPRGWSY